MQSQQVLIDAQHLMLIPELKRINRMFKKDVRERIFTYIHVCARLDPKAPFFTADPNEIEALAQRNYFIEETDADGAFPTDPKSIKLITDGLKAYVKAYESPEVRMVRIFNDKIDQIRKLVKDTNPEIVKTTNPTTGAVSFSSNVDILTKSMEKIDSLMATKERLEAKIRRESEGKGSVRGGKKPSRLERKSMQG